MQCFWQCQMKIWRAEFNEKVKQYKWSIDYEYDGVNGTYRGKGVKGKSDGLGVLSNEYWRIEGEWKNG